MNNDDFWKRMEIAWGLLGGAARDVLIQLCKKGPTWDGDVVSKSGRDELVRKGLAARIVLKDCEFGYQAATYLGAHCYRVAIVEPRKESVRTILGPDFAQHVSSR